MELTINNQILKFEKEPASLAELLLWQKLKQTKGIAVALNNQVIPKDLWDTTSLSQNDTILIITATQGG